MDKSMTKAINEIAETAGISGVKEALTRYVDENRHFFRKEEMFEIIHNVRRLNG